MKLLYEDGAVTAHLKEDGAVTGHIVVRPKQEAKTLSELPEEVVVQLWYCASFAATAVYEGLGAQGTNIICYEGDQLELHVLARQPQDGLELLWEANRAEPAQLDSVANKVKDQFWYVGKEEKPSEAKQEPPRKASAPKSGVDHRILHLRRKP